MSKTEVREIEFPATLEHLESIKAFITEYALELGFDEKKVFQIELAVDELAVNIISYAYQGGDGHIKLICQNEPLSHLSIEIIDHGVAFNPLEAKEPDINAELQDRPIGGLGLYLIPQMVDEISYQRNGGQNHLTILKYL